MPTIFSFPPVKLAAGFALACSLIACGGKISESGSTSTSTSTSAPDAIPKEWVGTWTFSVNDTIGHCETPYDLKNGTKGYAGRFTYEIASDGSFIFKETIWPKTSCDKLTDNTNYPSITSISQLESEQLGVISFRGKFTDYKSDGSIQVKDAKNGNIVSTGLRGTAYVQSLHDATASGITFSSTAFSDQFANVNLIQRKNQKHTGVVLNLEAPSGGFKDAICFVDRPLEQNHATLIGDKNSVNGGDWHCHFQ
jgi:hypothetical protein